jgi:hypothetical protein
MIRTRKRHSPSFRVKVGRAALKGDRTVAELTDLFRVHPSRPHAGGIYETHNTMSLLLSIHFSKCLISSSALL